MHDTEPSYEELARRCRDAERALADIKAGTLDRITGDHGPLVVRLAEAEAREAHLKQVLLAIRNVNQLIVQEDDPQRLIERACALLTGTLGFQIAWIALFGTGGTTATRATASGLDDRVAGELYARLARGDFPPCVRHALARDTPLVRVPATDCAGCPLAARPHDRADVVARLAFGGLVYGVLAVAMPAQFATGMEEQGLFAEVAGDLAFALHKIETEQRHREAEARVRDSEERLRLLVDHSRDGVALHQIILDEGGAPIDYIFLEANPAFEAHTGLCVAHILGRRVTEVIPGIEDTGLIQTYGAVALTGESTSFELAVDPMQRTYQVSAYQVGHGRFACVFTDTTGQRRREETLRAMADMLDTAPSAITVHDADGRFLYANQRTFEMHGYTAREFMALELRQLDTPESAALIETRMAQIARDGEASFEVEHVGKDGSLVPLAVYAKAVTWAGTPAALGIWTDITERKRTEEALRESERRLQLATASAQLGVWDLDLQTDTLVWDDWMFRIYGIDRGAFSSCLDAWQSGLHPDHAGMALDTYHAALRGERAYDTEFRIIRPDGAVRTIKADAVIIRDADGAPLRMIGLNRDITEQREAEAERARLQEQLQQAQRLESIGQLAGGVAHDLNNLLVPILGYGELLLAQLGPDDRHAKSVRQIVQAGERARDLVRQLLAFGRKQVLEFRPFDLNAVLAGFVPLLRRTIREDIAIELSPASDLPPIHGDVGQVEQILMNLAVNAQDAMPDGGLLTIETAAVELDADYAVAHEGVAPDSYVMLAISDTGLGMDPETRARIFEPFFTTKAKGSGTGLGLATVYGIVKQHGGNIWVYSEPGQGTMFKIYLPAARDGHRHASATADAPQIRMGSETVLLVEDNAQVRGLARTVLESHGYAVLEAHSGAAALDLLKDRAGPIDLLLTDVVMPGMNGRELYAHVARLCPDVRVLYMSGYTENVIAHRGVLDAGVQFIQKPFTVEGLAAQVRHVLDG